MSALPSTIGPYRLLGKVGEGGMGAVYEAVHEAIERRVAIKVLLSEYAKNEEFIARFFNEARVVNRVTHPGLVQVSDYGKLDDGTAYIVMEFLKGESLSARIKRTGSGLAIADVLRLSGLIADSLTAAHDKGIVHRDLKPENVMIVADSGVPGGERTKLLDFGIAKVTDAKEFVKTKTNSMLGSPLYMSPEQCRGAGKVDERSDVYSFGVLLFAMIAGRTPFDGEGLGEIMGKHLYETPPPLESLVPSVPAPLCDLVVALMSKDREKRPSMREICSALSSMAANLPNLPIKTPAAARVEVTAVVREPGEHVAQTGSTELDGKAAPRRRTRLALLAAVPLLGFVALFIARQSTQKPQIQIPPPVAAATPPVVTPPVVTPPVAPPPPPVERKANLEPPQGATKPDKPEKSEKSRKSRSSAAARAASKTEVAEIKEVSAPRKPEPESPVAAPKKPEHARPKIED